MFGLGTGEIVVLLFIVLIFIGPKKLPELATGLARAIREFQKAKNEVLDEVKKEEPSQAKTLPKKEESLPEHSAHHL
jgi:sec-independent protein translocase protein TatA